MESVLNNESLYNELRSKIKDMLGLA